MDTFECFSGWKQVQLLWLNFVSWTCLRSRSHACTSHTAEQHQNFPMQQNVGPYTCSRAEMSDQPSPQTSARRVFNRAEGASAASFKAEVRRRRRRWVMLLFTEGESNRGGRLRAAHVHREREAAQKAFQSAAARGGRGRRVTKSTFRSFIPLFYVLELRLASDWST